MNRVLLYIIVSVLVVLELYYESMRIILQHISVRLYSTDIP